MFKVLLGSSSVAVAAKLDTTMVMEQSITGTVVSQAGHGQSVKIA